MECMACGYILTTGSIVDIVISEQATRAEYRCRNCRAEMTIERRLTKPSPLPAEELKRRTNGVGSHAR